MAAATETAQKKRTENNSNNLCSCLLRCDNVTNNKAQPQPINFEVFGKIYTSIYMGYLRPVHIGGLPMPQSKVRQIAPKKREK